MNEHSRSKHGIESELIGVIYLNIYEKIKYKSPSIFKFINRITRFRP